MRRKAFFHGVVKKYTSSRPDKHSITLLRVMTRHLGRSLEEMFLLWSSRSIGLFVFNPIPRIRHFSRDVASIVRDFGDDSLASRPTQVRRQ